MKAALYLKRMGMCINQSTKIRKTIDKTTTIIVYAINPITPNDVFVIFT